MPPPSGRQVVATQGPGMFLVALETPGTELTNGVIVNDGAVSPALPLQSIYARGYWKPWTGTVEEAAAILALVPRSLPASVIFDPPQNPEGIEALREDLEAPEPAPEDHLRDIAH